MNLIGLVTLSLLVVMASSALPPKVHYDIENADSYFKDFMRDYNREYKDDADREVHYKAFVENLGKINDMNEKSPSAVFGINKFADYTAEERKSMHGIMKIKD